MAMNGCGKSDRSIDTEEPFEQEQGKNLLAEEREGRGLTEGNLFWQKKCRTLGRERGQYGEP
jgi:hypothetical protein